MLIHGLYRFRHKPVAYRPDFCLTCEQPRLSILVRSFWVLHLFFVPLVPLGFHRNWVCTSCSEDPTKRTRTSRPLVMALLVLLGLFAAFISVLVVANWGKTDDDRALSLLFPLGLWGAFAATIRGYRRTRKPLRAAELRAGLVPTSTTTCALCGGALSESSPGPMPRTACPACKVERLG